MNSLSLFGDISIPKALAQRLVHNSTVEQFKDGEIIIDVNDAPGKFYIIEKGSVQVLSEMNKDGTFGGKDLALRVGGHFGEQALVANAPHTKRFVAMTETMLITLNAEEFHAVLRPLLYKLDDLEIEVSL